MKRGDIVFQFIEVDQKTFKSIHFEFEISDQISRGNIGGPKRCIKSKDVLENGQHNSFRCFCIIEVNLFQCIIR